MRVAIVNDSRNSQHYGSILVMNNLERLLKEHDHEVVWTWPINVDWRKHLETITKLAPVDAVIINAEGLIHHGPRRWQAQSLVEFEEYAHKQLNVPIFLVNATLYENADSVYDQIQKFDGIYVRDKASLAILQSKNILAEYIPDLTFAFPSQLMYKPSRELCVIDSVMQSDVPHLKRFAKQRGSDYRRISVARPSKYNFWKRPRRYLLESARWLLSDRKKSLDPQEFETHLSSCGLVVTGRYHAVTLCMKQRIPFVALESNTPKISFLLNDVFGSTHRIIHLKDLEKLKVEEWRQYSDAEAEALDDFLSAAIEANQGMLNSITSRMGGK